MPKNFDVVAKIDVVETNGKEMPFKSGRVVTINNHWNRSELVVISTGNDAETITVNIHELRQALDAVACGSRY